MLTLSDQKSARERLEDLFIHKKETLKEISNIDNKLTDLYDTIFSINDKVKKIYVLLDKKSSSSDFFSILMDLNNFFMAFSEEKERFNQLMPNSAINNIKDTKIIDIGIEEKMSIADTLLESLNIFKTMTTLSNVKKPGIGSRLYNAFTFYKNINDEHKSYYQLKEIRESVLTLSICPEFTLFSHLSTIKRMNDLHAVLSAQNFALKSNIEVLDIEIKGINDTLVRENRLSP